jgi:hypothetical protein
MKNSFIIIFTITCFAFEKSSVAAVPIQEKSIHAIILKDSLNLDLYDDHYWNEEEKAQLKIFDLIHEARIIANIAFFSILFFLLCAIIAETGIFSGALTLAFISIISGFISSIVSIAKVSKIQQILNNFPTLETNKLLMKSIMITSTRSIIALLLLTFSFSFFIFYILNQLTINIAPILFPSKLVKAIMFLELFLVLDKLFFQTKSKTTQQK